MIFIYNLILYLYYFTALMLSPFNRKARLWIKGRKGVFNYLKKIDHYTDVVWFHASSLGEFEQGRPIMEAMRKENPETKILLTFFSPSGFELRKNYKGADYICYLPLDTVSNAKRFLQTVKPKQAFFIKYEFWYHYITQAKKQGIKIYSVSAIFRENQIFFKSYGKWYAKVLRKIDHFFVQNETSAELLNSIGINNVIVAGDSRFDRVAEIANASKEIEIAKNFSNGKFTIVCGSTWPPDEDLLCRYINQSENKKFIIAPHEINDSHIKNLQNKVNKKQILFSKAIDQPIRDYDVLIIDNIGMLSALYRYGKIGYIGGGFGVGIHNTLEAAVYGIPVVFGPKYQKFHEARELIRCEGGYSIENYSQLEEQFDLLYQDNELLNKSSKASLNYVKSMKGATRLIMEHLEKEK